MGHMKMDKFGRKTTEQKNRSSFIHINHDKFEIGKKR